MVHPYSSIGTDWNKLCFILSDRLDFHVIDNRLIVVHASQKHMLTSLSVDEILLPSYENESTNFWTLPLSGDGSILFKILILFYLRSHRSVPFAAYSRQCSRVSVNNIAWSKQQKFDDILLRLCNAVYRKNSRYGRKVASFSFSRKTTSESLRTKEA